MSGRVVNLNRERWLALADLALAAAATLKPEAVEASATAAGRMQAATPPASDPERMTLCLAFRWAVQNFGLTDPARRPALAEGLKVYAWAVRAAFDGRRAPPLADALAAPAASVIEAAPPAWTQRADIGG